MFDDISDDEDIETDMSDEQLDLRSHEMYYSEQKKPGPLEVILYICCVYDKSMLQVTVYCACVL